VNKTVVKAAGLDGGGDETVHLVDIGLNLADSRFAADYVAVLERACAAGVGAAVLTGISETGSLRVLELCRELAMEFPGILRCTVGVHPHEARHWRAHTRTVIADLASAAEVVAIGETGLDYYRDVSPREVQERVFVEQLELAAEVGLPVFLHERDAHRRQFEILKTYRDVIKDGVIHCFTGDRDSLFRYLDLDLHIGITGWVCDERRGRELAAVVAHIPLDRLMLETDAPYLLPRNLTPLPRNRRNEPAYLPWVLHGVAACRPESTATIAAATTANARRFFRFPE
jgi:TatD DNase family protein